jgi:glycerophosphoryl diester phosphodiesterase
MPLSIEIIAHRGAGQSKLQPDTPPENTLAAFAYAWSREVNADAAELDVHLTSDGEIVVIHDDTTRRTTNADWVVAEHTLAELRSLDAGSWKAPQFAGTRIPTLTEAIETIPRGKRLFTEIKTSPRIVDRLVQVVRRSGRPASQLPLISFSFEVIRRAKEKLPDHECYLVVSFKDLWLAQLRSPFAGSGLIQLVQSAGLDGIDGGFPMPRGWPEQMRRHNLKSVVWTVNHVGAARQLIEGGIRSITTDRPRQLRAALLGEKR